MKMLILASLMFSVATAFASGPDCNYDKSVLNFEKRMDLVGTMKGATVSRDLATVPDESSRITKFSKPIRSGQYMGLRQYAVYGFVGCELLMVRVGKVNPKDGEIAAEATVYLRDDGNLKASCKGSGRVLRLNPMLMQYEPNPECICYDANSMERRPGRKTGCAEMDDFDKDAVTLSTSYLDFVNPEEAVVDNSGLSVQFEQKESYFSDNSRGTRTQKNVFGTVKKNMKKIPSISSGEPDSGNVTVLLKIEDTGEVSSSMVASTTLMDRNVAESVREAVSEWDFGKSGKGDVMVYLVFRVAPSM